jgi:Tol biopolymer transport system component
MMRGFIPLVVLALVGSSACTTEPRVRPGRTVGCDWSAPTNLGQTVNGGSFEGGPSLSSDGLTLYFASDRVGGYGKEDIWASTRRTTSDAFGSPTNLGSTVNSVFSDFAPDIAADGLSVYFGSDRSGGVGDVDLWIATRASTSEAFGAPKDLGPGINSQSVDDHPNISEDGLALYFTSSRAGGSGDADLWVATRPVMDEPFGSPVSLGPTVNSPSYDGEPSISADGLTLYFASDRTGGIGARDIWVAARSSPSPPFAPAKDIGRIVNSGSNDATPDVSSDGGTLLFLSDRPGSRYFDLWRSQRRTCSGS